MTFTPTEDENGDPTTCFVCARHAIGVGITHDRKPAWLCRECVDIVEHIRAVRRLDPYELRAIDHGVSAVGEYLDSIGKYDLAEMDEIEARAIVKAAWLGCADGLRKELKGPPF